jgi:hypothetical protein
MLGIHRWPHAGLLIVLWVALAACSNRAPEPPEPLDLSQPIAVDQAGQAVRFTFEMNARNFIPHRTYTVDLQVQRQQPASPADPDMRSLRIPFEVTLQQWVDGAWQKVLTYDSYQAGVLNAGETLPEWHASESWRYARLRSGSDGQYEWSIVALPVALDTRYRLEVRTVQPTTALQQYSAHLRVRAAQPAGK